MCWSGYTLESAGNAVRRKRLRTPQELLSAGWRGLTVLPPDQGSSIRSRQSGRTQRSCKGALRCVFAETFNSSAGGKKLQLLREVNGSSGFLLGVSNISLALDRSV